MNNKIIYNHISMPRMRTVPMAYKEIKRIDPNTSLTLRALRRMLNNNEIPYVKVGAKRLVDLDLIFDILSSYNNKC